MSAGQSLSAFKQKVRVLFSDIDDTMTDEGRLHAHAYEALWALHRSGIHVIPVTGRPAGWCEMIARQWPVTGVIGENGGFYFRYDQKSRTMRRHFAQSSEEQTANRKKLQTIENEILTSVPGSAIASDQFCRLLDLAVDFCEDVPALPKAEVLRIKSIFEKHGAIAKISSIHVNGWFGDHDKLSMTLEFLRREFQMKDAQIKTDCAFVGDSPNDEPMWSFFPNSFAVANIRKFWSDLQHHPEFVASHNGGEGFAEVANTLIRALAAKS